MIPRTFDGLKLKNRFFNHWNLAIIAISRGNKTFVSSAQGDLVLSQGKLVCTMKAGKNNMLKTLDLLPSMHILSIYHGNGIMELNCDGYL